MIRDFPGGPVVKTSPPSEAGVGLISSQEAKIQQRLLKCSTSKKDFKKIFKVKENDYITEYNILNYYSLLISSHLDWTSMVAQTVKNCL